MIRPASPVDPLRVAVLASGRGSNLVALFEHADPAVAIVAVVSNRGDSAALERAREYGVEAVVFPSGDDRATRDAALADWLRARDVELVVLAGFMELLTPVLVDAFPTVNVHPSLLPAFPGLRAWEQALAAGVAETGVTVHLVDHGLDTGPILAQESVAVLPGDDAATLHARIQEVEHRLLPDVVGRLARDQVATPQEAVG